MKKALVAIALMLPVTGAFAQSNDNSVVGFYLSQGSTYNGYTCPSTNITPCFVPYGSTIPVTSSVSPSSRTLVALDVSSVTTGGTAVTALTSGHKTAGGFLNNPDNATVDLCINEIGTASGTSSSGNTSCIAPGQSYALTPSSGAVSVISSDSSHPFSGYGLQ